MGSNVNRSEAKELLSKHIERLKKRPYGELKELLNRDKLEYFKETGKSGAKYQIKIHAVWDDKRDGALRVFVEIDDGGWRSFFPLADSFIITPIGTFAGE
jgi:hypothetical protein